MDNSFLRQGSNTQQQSGLLATLRNFNSILNWLVGLFQLTEEVQKDAGIYLGDQRFE